MLTKAEFMARYAEKLHNCTSNEIDRIYETQGSYCKKRKLKFWQRLNTYCGWVAPHL